MLLSTLSPLGPLVIGVSSRLDPRAPVLVFDKSWGCLMEAMLALLLLLPMPLCEPIIAEVAAVSSDCTCSTRLVIAVIAFLISSPTGIDSGMLVL